MISWVEILSLTAYLRRNNFRVSAEDISKLLFLMNRRNIDVRSIRGKEVMYLAKSVICKDAWDQNRFDVIFQNWVISRSAVTNPTDEGDDSHLGVTPASPYFRGVFLKILSLFFLLLIFSGYKFFSYNQEHTFDVYVVNSLDPSKRIFLHGVNVDAGKCIGITNRDGVVHCSVEPARFPIIVNVRSGPNRATALVFDDRATWRWWISFGELKPVVLELGIFEGSPLIARPPVQPVNLSSKMAVIGMVVVVLLVFFSSVLLLSLLLNNVATLRRKKSKVTTDTRNLTGTVVVSDFQVVDAMNGLALALRHSIRKDHGRIDIQRTIDATLLRAGMFSPQFGARTERRFLIFFQRQCKHDHHALLSEGLIRALSKSGLDLQVYSFQSDGAVMQPFFFRDINLRKGDGVRKEKSYTITQILANNPDAECFIFCVPTALLDLNYRRVGVWCSALIKMSLHTTLFSFCPNELWGDVSAVICKEGVRVVPVEVQELLNLTAGVAPKVYGRPCAYQNNQWQASGRRMLTSEYFLHRTPVTCNEVKYLCDVLRGYLGNDGLRWMQACAVYPEIQFTLTNAIGGIVIKDKIRREIIFMKLCNLIWFQRAYMPDWLRIVLIDSLSPRDVDMLKVYFWKIFSDSTGSDVVVISLVSDWMDFSGLKYFKKVIAWLKFEINLLIGIRKNKCDERIFIDFLLGKRSKTLDMAMPKKIYIDLINLPRSPRIIFCAGILSFIIGFLCLYWLLNMPSDEGNSQKTENGNVATVPSSSIEVGSTRTTILSEDIEWERLIGESNLTIESYKTFLKQFPNSKYIDEINKRINEIEKKLKVPVDFSDPFMLNVKISVKPWGDVRIDGKKVGVSPPLRRFQLPEGIHEIRILNPAYPDYVKEINVRSTNKKRIESLDVDLSDGQK